MPSEKNKPPSKVAGGKFEIGKKLGAGCFGEVYLGKNTQNDQEVAIKFEDSTGRALQLSQEAEVLKYLAKPTCPQGIVEIFYFGTEGAWNCLVMEALGRSIEDRVQGCKGQFNVKTTVLVAEQVLMRIEYLHSRGIVHRDIKPENFMFGTKEKILQIYVIDFGLSKRYWDEKHAQMRQKLSLTGTARYASINAHKGIEQSRRDDLEAIGHMFLYFLRGSLPWSGLDAKTQEEKYRKIREKKEETPIPDLCKGYPDAFMQYLQYCRNLEFKQRPDYTMLRKLFSDVKASEKIADGIYQWLEGRDLGTLVPLNEMNDIRQPDDAKPSAKGGFCLCGSKSAVKD